MNSDLLMFQEFLDLCDEQYEYGLIEFKNGDIMNAPGENDGSAKVLSYAALAEFDKDMTLKVSFNYSIPPHSHTDCPTFFLQILTLNTVPFLMHEKLWGQYYRDVLANPNMSDHQNIRNFFKYGWEGVDFSNGIALTKKCVGGNAWDWDSESFIP